MILESTLTLVRLRLGYACDNSVLAQLGFGLARAWLALAWLELCWALTILVSPSLAWLGLGLAGL